MVQGYCVLRFEECHFLLDKRKILRFRALILAHSALELWMVGKKVSAMLTKYQFFCIAQVSKWAYNENFLTSPFWEILIFGYLPYKAMMVLRGNLKLLWSFIVYLRWICLWNPSRDIKSLHLKSITIICDHFEVP